MSTIFPLKRVNPIPAKTLRVSEITQNRGLKERMLAHSAHRGDQKTRQTICLCRVCILSAIIGCRFGALDFARPKADSQLGCFRVGFSASYRQSRGEWFTRPKSFFADSPKIIESSPDLVCRAATRQRTPNEILAGESRMVFLSLQLADPDHVQKCPVVPRSRRMTDSLAPVRSL